MHFLYDLAVHFSWLLLQIAAIFNHKIHQFVKGRKEVISYIRSHRDPDRPLIWMHTASLGEFEQGLPVLERVESAFPGHQILVTFFSPSGYEVKKDRLGKHLVTYLPLDTQRNARRFLLAVKPDIALFVKYEVWPQFFRELERKKIPILLFSAIYRPRQAYFKWYGGILRRALKRVAHFYVQDGSSADLLKSIGIQQVTISGDTRFDRVLKILDSPRPLPFMEDFKNGRPCLVGGSTWPEDHDVLVPYINAKSSGCCFVIAPHKMDPRILKILQEHIDKKSVLYSEIEPAALKEADVLIIDTIGLLTQIYRYADIAYVGGGFGTGLHNTLEPAVFGIPVLIGPDYEGFREAEDLVLAGGIGVVANAEEFEERTAGLMDSPVARRQVGSINSAYILENKGASDKILQGIRRLLG